MFKFCCSLVAELFLLMSSGTKGRQWQCGFSSKHIRLLTVPFMRCQQVFFKVHEKGCLRCPVPDEIQIYVR